MPLSETQWRAHNYDKTDYDPYYIEQRLWPMRGNWPGLFNTLDDLDGFIVPLLNSAHYSFDEIYGKIDQQYQNVVVVNAVAGLQDKVIALSTPTTVATVTPPTVNNIADNIPVVTGAATPPAPDESGGGSGWIIAGSIAILAGGGFMLYNHNHNKKSKTKKK